MTILLLNNPQNKQKEKKLKNGKIEGRKEQRKVGMKEEKKE